MKKYFLICLFSIIFQNINAQENKTNEAGSWFTLVNKFKITDKLSVSNITQIRLVNFIEDSRIFLLAPGVNYKLGKVVTASAGYMYLNFNEEGIRVPGVDLENRIWEAVSFSSSIWKIKMKQRFMLEQRFLSRRNGSEFYQNRFRYRLNLDFNLFKLKNDKYILGKISEEIRIRSRPGYNEPEFDQNNFGVFLGYQLLDNSKIYAGYQRNYYKIPDFWGDNVLHVIFTYDFDFTKKKFWK